jgi:hypothetical protein
LPIWFAASVANQRGGHEVACKGNYAAYVKRITPQSFPERGSHGRKYRIMCLAPEMPDSKRSKRDVLIEEGAFNPAPDKVLDPKFRGGEFFDPRDAVQVKYEMLRRVSIDKLSITDLSTCGPGLPKNMTSAISTIRNGAESTPRQKSFLAH